MSGASRSRNIFVPSRFHHTDCSGAGFASVLALKPKTRVKSPATLPAEEIHAGSSASTHGPNRTMPAAPIQQTLPIMTQAPERAHHSRSPSPVDRLANPIKSVAARRKKGRKTGTVARVYQSASLGPGAREPSFTNASRSNPPPISPLSIIASSSSERHPFSKGRRSAAHAMSHAAICIFSAPSANVKRLESPNTVRSSRLCPDCRYQSQEIVSRLTQPRVARGRSIRMRAAFQSIPISCEAVNSQGLGGKGADRPGLAAAAGYPGRRT